MNKLYVITRNDLGVVYAAVQSAHAVAQWLLDHPNQTWNNEYLVVLSVKDETELNKMLFKAKLKLDNLSVFHEPDLNGELTAFACYTNSPIFSKLKLLGN